MSGGEITLSSLCLLLPFQDLFFFKWYLLDEIDATLDFKNVTKLSFHFKYQIKNSQIFLITLRNNLILKIDYIFAIYKFKKTSKTICLRI
jgi:chromosome segregation ATPase